MNNPIHLNDTLPKLQEIVNNLLIVLSQKEKHIIENRFSLNGRPKATLEKIGKEFNVTRERIRQIEKNALRKLQRNVGNTDLSLLNEFASLILDRNDGLCEEVKMVSEILKMAKAREDVDVSSAKLSISLDKNIVKVNNTIYFRPHWKRPGVSHSMIKKVCDRAHALLKKKSDVVDADKFLKMVKEKFEKDPMITTRLIHAALDLDRRIKVVPEGVGLSSWRHINPKTLRDKIYFILRHQGKPLHYVEIANKIAGSTFDKKVVNTQAVHNELIRYPQFILIGRGIYALAEWGYEAGTVADVVTSILKNSSKPMSREEIVAAVLKRRQVKKITILLNLKNKPQFERVGRDKYKLT
jgi:hypothetical protein